jgi:type I restriction enzyme S subunit
MELEMKLGFKQTEIGLIPEDWDFIKIQHLIDDRIIVGHLDGNHGALYPRSSEFTNFGVPYITANDFLTGSVNFNDLRYLPTSRAEQFQKGIAKNGDVLFAHNATVGPTAVLKMDLDYVILSTTATYFRTDKQKLNNYYLRYFFESEFFVRQYSAVMRQSTRNQIPITQQRKFSIVLPPTLEEQKAIATALSDVDNLISNLDALILKKKAIKQGAMQQLLTPDENWQTKTIKELATYRRGSFPQPYGLSKWYDDINGMPFVQVVDVDKNNKLKPETKQKISTEGAKKSVFVEKGTIILTLQGSIGRICITQYDAYVDRTLLIFESIGSNISKYFFMLSVWLKFQIEKENAPGGIIKTITKEALSKFEISYPDLDNQNRIAEILSDMDKEIEELVTKKDKYEHLKQGMMQELLTGKTRLI